jgi:hypothetical protein
MQFPGGQIALDKYLQAGDLLLKSSSDAEKSGNEQLALTSAQQAIIYFEQVGAFSKQATAGVGSFHSGPDSSTRSAYSATSTGPSIRAASLTQTTYKPDDVVHAVIEITDLARTSKFERIDTLMMFQGNDFQPIYEPITDVITVDPPGRRLTLELSIDQNMAAGTYKLQSEIKDTRNSDQTLLKHDFVFAVIGAQASSSANDKVINDRLGPIGKALDKLGVKVRIGEAQPRKN